MKTPTDAVQGRLMRFVSELKFPKLLALTAVLFVMDLLLPDFIPFIDEILLGLTTLILGSIKKRRTAPLETTAAPRA